MSRIRPQFHCFVLTNTSPVASTPDRQVGRPSLLPRTQPHRLRRCFRRRVPAGVEPSAVRNTAAMAVLASALVGYAALVATISPVLAR